MKADHIESTALRHNLRGPRKPSGTIPNTQVAGISIASPSMLASRKSTDSETAELTTEDLKSMFLSDLRRFLGSSIFRDIGPVTARRIVAAFGIMTVKVIVSTPHELLTVKGVGKGRMLAVHRGWRFQRKLIRDSAELIKLLSS